VSLASDTNAVPVLSSAFCRDTIAGWIFVETYSLNNIKPVISGLSGVLLS